MHYIQLLSFRLSLIIFGLHGSVLLDRVRLANESVLGQGCTQENAHSVGASNVHRSVHESVRNAKHHLTGVKCSCLFTFPFRGSEAGTGSEPKITNRSSRCSGLAGGLNGVKRPCCLFFFGSSLGCERYPAQVMWLYFIMYINVTTQFCSCIRAYARNGPSTTWAPPSTTCTAASSLPRSPSDLPSNAVPRSYPSKPPATPSSSPRSTSDTQKFIEA